MPVKTRLATVETRSWPHRSPLRMIREDAVQKNEPPTALPSLCQKSCPDGDEIHGRPDPAHVKTVQRPRRMKTLGIVRQRKDL